MKAFFTRAVIATVVSVVLVMWVGHPAACTRDATAGPTFHPFYAFTSMT
jgi:hypothetical protein